MNPYRYEESVILSGIGRSGTTWLSNLINYDKRFRTLFEPFHPEEGIALRTRITNAMYRRPDQPDPEITHGLIALLSGEMFNDYVDQDNKGDYGNRLLMKTIRLNTMLPWMHVNLPEVPIIYLSRHPAAVIASQIRMGWDTTDKNLKRILNQEELIEDYLTPFVPLIKKAQNEFEYRLYFWCVTNYVLKKYFTGDEIYWVMYETLQQNPQAEMRRVFSFLDQSYDESALASLIDRPSRTTWKETRYYWTDIINVNQQAQMWETLKIFGLDDLYNKHNAPEGRKITLEQRFRSTIKRIRQKLRN